MLLALGDTLLAILAFVIILGAIIIIHEGGHFYFAVRAGILCREYAFGMGPLLWKKKKGETTYSIRCLPIGGFCAICGEESETDPLKGLTKIRFELINGIITKIYLPTDGKNKVNLFDDKPLYDLVSYDVYDKNDTGELYLEIGKKVLNPETNEEETVTEKIPVARNAYYVFGVGKHADESKSKEYRLNHCVEEFQIGPHDRTLNSKGFWQRFMVMFGGPMMNFVLAIVAFFISILITGTSNTKSAEVGEFGYETIIAKVEKTSDYCGISNTTFEAGKEYNVYGYVVSINGNEVKLASDIPFGEEFNATLKEDEKVHLFSYVVLKGTYNNSKLENATVVEETRIVSPLYISGVREGDVITKLSSTGLENVNVSSWNDISKYMDDYASLTKKDVITVSYNEDGDSSKPREVIISPMVYIYSISMVQDIASSEVRIDELSEQSKAYQGGLREGDIISKIEINGTTYDIHSWLEVADCFMIPTDGKTEVKLFVSREGETELVECSVTPYAKELFDKTQNVGIVEMKMGITCTSTRNIFQVVKATFVQMGSSIAQLFNTLGLLIFSSSVGIKDLSGPVGIFSMTKTAVSGGIGYLFYWLGFLSVNVGFMNLLPIPALDGGRILFLIIEKIRRKPLSQKAQDIAINVTYYALLALILYVTVNDVLRMIK